MLIRSFLIFYSSNSGILTCSLANDGHCPELTTDHSAGRTAKPTGEEQCAVSEPLNK